MATNNKNPLRSDDRYIYCDADAMEFLIPKNYFDKGTYAVEESSFVRVFGLFPVVYYYNDKPEMKTLNCPFFIKAYKYLTDEGDRDLPGEGVTRCFILKYLKGQKIMESSVEEDSNDAVTYIRKFINMGKIPKTIPYSQSPSVWQKNKEVAGVDFGVRTEVEETILSLVYRNPKELGEKFATPYGSDLSVGEYDFVEANNRQIAQYASTFTSMTFEDLDSMITTSLNRTRTKGKELYTPVEDIIKL